MNDLKVTVNNVKQYLDENQIDIFYIKDLKNKFKTIAYKEFRHALSKIIDFEYTKVENGKYCRNTFRDEYVIGNYLTSDATIAYWSALNIHGLTEQFPNKVYVQTTKKKKNTEIFGVYYQIVKVHPNKMTGIIKSGIGSHQFRITDIEKTFIDCFDLINYSGGFMELIRAFKRTKLNAQKMLEYSQALNNKAINKRIGYLAELFNKKGFKQFIKYAKEKKSKNYDLFDIYGYDEGKYNSEWRLRLNISNENLMDIVNSIY
jgi:predicted transcriptional regulator of viral defense system